MLPKFTSNFVRFMGRILWATSKVRQWCRLFEEGRTNVHDEERSGRPSFHHRRFGGKSEHNTSWKSSLYNFRTVPRVSTSFKISDLWYCVREARLQKTVCQMGAENVNRRKTSRNVWLQLINFCNAIKLKEISVLTILSLGMRRGFPTQTSSQSDSQCNGATHRPRNQRSSSKHLQSEKSWPPFSGTERGSCLLIF